VQELLAKDIIISADGMADENFKRVLFCCKRIYNTYIYKLTKSVRPSKKQLWLRNNHKSVSWASKKQRTPEEHSQGFNQCPPGALILR